MAPGAADALASSTGSALQEPIVASREGLLAGHEQPRQRLTDWQIRVRGVRSGEERSLDAQDVVDVADARARLELAVRTALAEMAPPTPTPDWNRNVVVVARWLASHLHANLTWNAAETERRRQEAADRVPPVIVRAWRGETVLRPGEVITERHGPAAGR
jgi:hypothetical protein